MESRESKQSGFSIVEVVLIVAAIGIIGAGGWLVYQHNRTKATSAAPNASNQQTQQTITTTPAPTVTYLDIKEWGVKLPLSDNIKDAYYIPGISSKGNDGLPNQMWIGLKPLDSNGCTTTNNSGPALIFRALPNDTDPVGGQLLTQEYPNGTTIGTYYYGYEDFTTSSSNSCKVPQTMLQTVHEALADAIKSAVPMN